MEEIIFYGMVGLCWLSPTAIVIYLVMKYDVSKEYSIPEKVVIFFLAVVITIIPLVNIAIALNMLETFEDEIEKNKTKKLKNKEVRKYPQLEILENLRELVENYTDIGTRNGETERFDFLWKYEFLRERHTNEEIKKFLYKEKNDIIFMNSLLEEKEELFIDGSGELLETMDKLYCPLLEQVDQLIKEIKKDEENQIKMEIEKEREFREKQKQSTIQDLKMILEVKEKIKN